MITSPSPALRVGVTVVSPLAAVLSVYLLFAGHNQPGGGFAAGLVLGCVVALRTLAGLQRPGRAVLLLTGGVIACGIVAIAPVLVGRALLDQVVVEQTVPILGTVKTGSALLFDAGVTAIVVGLIVALLEGFGAASLLQVEDGPAGDGMP